MCYLNERCSIEENVLILVVIELESALVFEGCWALLWLFRLGVDWLLLLLCLIEGQSFSLS